MAETEREEEKGLMLEWATAVHTILFDACYRRGRGEEETIIDEITVAMALLSRIIFRLKA